MRRSRQLPKPLSTDWGADFLSLTPGYRGVKIENMSRSSGLVVFIALPLIVLAVLTRVYAACPYPAHGQNDKPDKSAPEVDPDAATYTNKYTPPGASKSVEIGNYYLRRKKYNGALSRFQEAVQENPAYAPAYLGLGKVYEKIGLKQKALDAYNKYLDALPSQKDALNAKEVQQAVAKLQQEIQSPRPGGHRHPARAGEAPNSQ